MNIEIRYFSRSGNTRKIAEAIGSQLNIKAEDVSVPLNEDTDILFIGGALYALHLDHQVVDFLKGLNSKSLKKIYSFSTTAILSSAHFAMKNILEKNNIQLEKADFHCRGKFGALYSDRPNKADIKRAGKFAQALIDEIKVGE